MESLKADILAPSNTHPLPLPPHPIAPQNLHRGLSMRWMPYLETSHVIDITAVVLWGTYY